MKIIDIPQKPVFGVESIDSKSDRARKFTNGLRDLASRCGGRLGKVEFKSQTIRILISNGKVHEGIIGYLRKRGIEAMEVELLDEFFAEAAPPKAS